MSTSNDAPRASSAQWISSFQASSSGATESNTSQSLVAGVARGLRGHDRGVALAKCGQSPEGGRWRRLLDDAGLRGPRRLDRMRGADGSADRRHEATGRVGGGHTGHSGIGSPQSMQMR